MTKARRRPEHTRKAAMKKTGRTLLALGKPGARMRPHPRVAGHGRPRNAIRRGAVVLNDEREQRTRECP